MRGWPTYYVIRHQSIYGNSDIITIDIFYMISLPSAVFSGFGYPFYHWSTVDCHSTIGHVANPCEYIPTLYKYSWVLYRCKMAGFCYLTFQKLFFLREILLLHSHLDYQCHLIFGKIVNKMLFQVLYTDSCTRTTSLCCIVLLRTLPIFF